MRIEGWNIMIFSLKTKILLIIGTLVVITISNYGFLLISENNATEEQAWVLHTHEVIAAAESLSGQHAGHGNGAARFPAHR